MRKFNILIVEDHNEHLEIITNCISNLTKPKINLIIKKKAENAYNFLLTNYFIDLFILDISLPDFSGDTILRYIRIQEEYERTPILILTMSNSIADHKRCNDFSVNEYIVKPTDFNELSLISLQQAINKYYEIWLKKRWLDWKHIDF